MPAPATAGQKRIALAAVAGAHGIKGEVRLKLFADSIASLARHPRLYVGGVERAVRDLREGGKTAIARLEGVSDRTAAEALRGSLVEVNREALPPLEEGEYYHADLLGLPCESAAGEPLGTVVAVDNFGAGDIVEIARVDGSRFMVPVKPALTFESDRLVVDEAFVE